MSPSLQRAAKIVAGILLAGVVVVAMLLVVRWANRQPAPPEILQGEIDGTTVEVASKVGARILTITAKEGQRVKRGDVLVTLDIPEARAKLAQAEAARQAAQSLEDKARRGARDEEIRQAEAAWQRAQVAVGLATKTFGRLDRLSKDGVVPAQRRDEAEILHALGIPGRLEGERPQPDLPQQSPRRQVDRWRRHAASRHRSRPLHSRQASRMAAARPPAIQRQALRHP